MERLALGAEPEAVRQEVLKISLEHQLVSKYTSLVAVDSMVSRPPGKNSKQAVVKTNLPHGWQASSLFGGGSQTATRSTLSMVAGLILFVLAVLLVFSRTWICRERC